MKTQPIQYVRKQTFDDQMRKAIEAKADRKFLLARAKDWADTCDNTNIFRHYG